MIIQICMELLLVYVIYICIRCVYHIIKYIVSYVKSRFSENDT